MGPNFRYWGFLSYSHDDRHVAERLHRSLETYRVPPRLVGLDGPFGPLPARLQPIFRDRDDLKAGCSLGPEVERALSTSRSLIVLCSPTAAASPWVDAEIAAFGRMQPGAPVFCVFLAGDPMAPVGIPGDAGECLPPAARARFMGEAGLGETAPIAVDLRPDGDGWRLAIHKIVAGLAGLPLDQLVQRDAQRRHRRMAWLSAVLAGVAIALGTLAVMAYRARDEARVQRAQAESLIEFMLVDLRKRLEPVGRLDALDAVGARALRYYDQQSLRSLDPDSLGRRARALHLIGEVNDRRGDMQAAREAFSNAREATAELLVRGPDEPQRLFDHAQSVYWLGYIDWQYGNVEGAEQAFKEYGRLSRRLSARDPSNPDWLTEVGYAHSNLGVLLLEQGRAVQAIPQFQQSLRVNRKRATLPGDALLVQLDISQDRSWLSSAYYANRQLRPAIAERQMELAIYDRLLAASPNNAQVKERKMLAHRFLGEMELASGDLGLAKRDLDISVLLADEQRKLDAANVSWQQSMAKSLVLLAEYARRQGDLRSAQRNLDLAGRFVVAQLAREPEGWAWRVELQELVAVERAALLLAHGRLQAADQALLAAQQRIGELASDGSPGHGVLRFQIANAALRAELAARMQDDAAERRAWRELEALAGARVDMLDGASALRLANAWRHMGRSPDSKRLRQQLVAAGFKDAEQVSSTAAAAGVLTSNEGEVR